MIAERSRIQNCDLCQLLRKCHLTVRLLSHQTTQKSSSTRSSANVSTRYTYEAVKIISSPYHLKLVIKPSH